MHSHIKQENCNELFQTNHSSLQLKLNVWPAELIWHLYQEGDIKLIAWFQGASFSGSTCLVGLSLLFGVRVGFFDGHKSLNLPPHLQTHIKIILRQMWPSRRLNKCFISESINKNIIRLDFCLLSLKSKKLEHSLIVMLLSQLDSISNWKEILECGIPISLEKKKNEKVAQQSSQL